MAAIEADIIRTHTGRKGVHIKKIAIPRETSKNSLLVFAS